MNPMALMKLKGLGDQFKANHPKVPLFFNAAAKEIREGSIIEITVTSPEGKNICTNMRVTADDMKLVQQIKELM